MANRSLYFVEVLQRFPYWKSPSSTPVLSMRNEVGRSKELVLEKSFVKTDTLLPRLAPETPIGDRPLWERFFRNKKFHARFSFSQQIIHFVITGLNPESVLTTPPNPTASQPFLTAEGLPEVVPNSNFAQICLMGMTSAHTGSEIKKGFQCLADRQGYAYFRCLLVDHFQGWTLYHGPQYNERRPFVWAPLRARPTNERPRSRRRRPEPQFSSPHDPVQTPPPPSSLPTSPPWISDGSFGARRAGKTPPVPHVSPLQLLAFSDETESNRTPSHNSENQDQRGAGDVTSTADYSPSTPLQFGDTDAEHDTTENPPYTSLTVREFIDMLLKARQNGHDDSTEDNWRFIPDEATPGRDHLEYLGRRINGIQLEVFIPRPITTNPTAKRSFCIYGCTKDGTPDGDREWLGPWATAMAHHRPDCQDDKKGRKVCRNPPPFFPIALKGLDNHIPLSSSDPIILYRRQPLKLNANPRLTPLYFLGRSLCSMGAERFSDPQCIEWRAREDAVKVNRNTVIIREYNVPLTPELMENGND